ncbi:tetratricopeptide repeat protein [Serratia proteamaculans]|uniref:tetratricopeptide repeat protein n=1 Tax=Serratia proteamaculans TaxID=28151 RepID=UPI0039AF6981
MLQAGVSSLKRYSKKLINKPIALEVFVQAASKPGESLENAFQRVQRMQRQDLGHFLYDDAWARLSPETRHVLLLMSRAGDTHDQFMMQLCCLKANVTLSTASDAIEESKGIASLTQFEGALQIAFNPEFYNYCSNRKEIISGIESPTVEEVDWVQRRYKEFVSNASAQVYDRNIKAFRIPLAKAAWKSFTDGDKEQAIEYYEHAILEDADNCWLYERYAHSLFTMKRYPQALDIIDRALRIIQDDSDVWFTKGMIEGRLGKITPALSALEKAKGYGKPQHLCELQKAYAYVNIHPKNILEAEKCIQKSLRTMGGDKMKSKFIAELKAFQARHIKNR